MSNQNNQGLVPLKDFCKEAGITSSLQFMRSQKTGRQMVSTPKGTLFMSKTFDKSKPAFVTVAGESVKSQNGASLAGTLWLCNSSLVSGDILELEIL